MLTCIPLDRKGRKGKEKLSDFFGRLLLGDLRPRTVPSRDLSSDPQPADVVADDTMSVVHRGAHFSPPQPTPAYPSPPSAHPQHGVGWGGTRRGGAVLGGAPSFLSPASDQPRPAEPRPASYGVAWRGVAWRGVAWRCTDQGFYNVIPLCGPRAGAGHWPDLVAPSANQVRRWTDRTGRLRWPDSYTCHSPPNRNNDSNPGEIPLWGSGCPPK